MAGADVGAGGEALVEEVEGAGEGGQVEAECGDAHLSG
jgi:hypothetical protein